MTLYTDIDPAACAVLEARVADGSLPPGDVLCADVRGLDEAALAGYRHVHLFAGIGGSPLGFALAGWPADWSLVTGGFPCQDISSAGRGDGLAVSRSGLYREMLRVIGITRPLGVLAENVGALSARGLGTVAAALESLGYHVTALRVGSWAVGAPDTRERWWFCCRRRGDGNELGELAGRGREGPGVPARPRVEGQAAGHPGGSGAERDLGHVDGGGRDGRARSPQRRSFAQGTTAGAGEVGELADERVCGLGAERVIETRADTDQPVPGIRVDLGERAGLEGLRHGARSAEITQPGHAGQRGHCGDLGRRWPHPRWCVTDGHGVKRTVPTPQYDWEPTRLFQGTRSVNAAWRLALMGYPPGWLDVPEETLLGLRPKGTAEARSRWWNKQGVIMTGNAQNAAVVELMAGAMVDAVEGMAGAES